MFAIDPLSCILYGPMYPLFDEGGCGTFATRHQLPPVNGGTVVGFNVVSDYWNLVMLLLSRQLAFGVTRSKYQFWRRGYRIRLRKFDMQRQVLRCGRIYDLSRSRRSWFP